ncbi:small integral membrane protein 20 isoform X2 [Erinaceus europaeus]|uniref:Small integral membrane protein 20 isoform X2 n=1 Tax=Erinaceus europaeus TaxID=9365 RepID=A0ABM3X5Y2_ERIEU|nr:small integral membrane protein 20 isoform X2 [Erinaceus europaeus]
MSRNLRTALIFGGFVSVIGAAFYPIYFRPLRLREEYNLGLVLNHFREMCWSARSPQT